jgi:hypothetical protein
LDKGIGKLLRGVVSNGRSGGRDAYCSSNAPGFRSGDVGRFRKRAALSNASLLYISFCSSSGSKEDGAYPTEISKVFATILNSLRPRDKTNCVCPPDTSKTRKGNNGGFGSVSRGVSA